ncbi:hypothetical protein RRF57_013072 [Xylaria bambusicola]|uniref:Uncharacterized protein n=1 Tax=Xylaria bambusicola TaxID=326684 RepID=A0AAN7UR45_9PEZI
MARAPRSNMELVAASAFKANGGSSSSMVESAIGSDTDGGKGGKGANSSSARYDCQYLVASVSGKERRYLTNELKGAGFTI